MRACRSHMKILLGLVSAMLLLLAGNAASAQTPEETFLKGGAAFREGRFQEAVLLYEGLIRSGKQSGHLFYNLANAYFRLDRLGPAILNYERARWFLPRDADLDFNLRLARDKTLDSLQEPQDLVTNTFFWIDTFNLAELFWCFAAINIAFWGTLVVRLFSKAEALYYVCLVLLTAWLAAGLTLGLKAYKGALDTRAVVLADEVDVLAGPDVKESVLFKLHAGTTVLQEREEEGWSLVRLPDKRRGWMMRGAVERVMEGLPWPVSGEPQGSREAGA